MDNALPLLRSDLALHPGPALESGEKSWTLHDPASNRFFRLGWLEFEALRRFNLVKTAQDLCALLRKETVLRVEPDDIAVLRDFLVTNDLIVQPMQAATNRFMALRAKRQKSLFSKALHGYLFFTVPLFRPRRALNAVLPYIAPLFTKSFFLSMMALLAFALTLTARRWDEFMHTALASFSLEGIAAGALAFIVIKIMHECAHALMATKYGVRVASMGVAVMVMYPVLYTETSGAWKLTRRKPRLLIGAAGMMAELCLAAIALLIWHIVPEGGAKSAAFFVGCISLIGTLAVNLNPLMRFDGYFLFSDALGFDNLQARGFALARWKLREVLFGLGEQPPEDLKPSLLRTVLLYSYAAWIYRFFLFSGIAVLVYHVFFPPLGLALMLVEIGWFIALPVWSEVKIWIQKRGEMRWNGPSRRSGWLAGALLIIVLFPWSGRVEVPGMLTPSRYDTLYPPHSAVLEELRVHDKEYVKKGETLALLASPELRQQRELARIELSKLEMQYRSERTSQALIGRTAVLESEVQQAREQLAGLERRIEALTLKAPFDGQVRDITPNLHPGRWLGADMPLMQVVADGEWIVQGYVYARDLNRLPEKMTGIFYSDTGIISPLKVEVLDIQKTNAPTLQWPALAGGRGGSIDVQAPPPERPDLLVPRESVYAVNMRVQGKQTVPFAQSLPGYVILEGERQSIIGLFLKQTAALVIRESGL